MNAPRSECDSALAEMQWLHYSYINADYHPDVVDSWESGGCRPEMERSVGYRLRVSGVDLPQSVAPGGSFSAVVTITNDGWAAPMNPRPVFLVLESGGNVYRLGIDAEVRSWLPGSASQLIFRGILPETVAEGSATIGLWLPDADSDLALDPRYSIRLAH